MALSIKPGDTIKIQCQGHTLTGKVLTAHSWQMTPDYPEDWYIEYIGEHGHAYWKQGDDGGTVEVIED